jgi:hypothetical protein
MKHRGHQHRGQYPHSQQREQRATRSRFRLVALAAASRAGGAVRRLAATPASGYGTLRRRGWIIAAIGARRARRRRRLGPGCFRLAFRTTRFEVGISGVWHREFSRWIISSNLAKTEWGNRNDTHTGLVVRLIPRGRRMPAEEQGKGFNVVRLKGFPTKKENEPAPPSAPAPAAIPDAQPVIRFKGRVAPPAPAAPPAPPPPAPVLVEPIAAAPPPVEEVVPFTPPAAPRVLPAPPPQAPPPATGIRGHFAPPPVPSLSAPPAAPATVSAAAPAAAPRRYKPDPDPARVSKRQWWKENLYNKSGRRAEDAQTYTT